MNALEKVLEPVKSKRNKHEESVKKALANTTSKDEKEERALKTIQRPAGNASKSIVSKDYQSLYDLFIKENEKATQHLKSLNNEEKIQVLIDAQLTQKNWNKELIQFLLPDCGQVSGAFCKYLYYKWISKWKCENQAELDLYIIILKYLFNISLEGIISKDSSRVNGGILKEIFLQILVLPDKYVRDNEKLKVIKLDPHLSGRNFEYFKDRNSIEFGPSSMYKGKEILTTGRYINTHLVIIHEVAHSVHFGDGLVGQYYKDLFDNNNQYWRVYEGFNSWFYQMFEGEEGKAELSKIQKVKRMSLQQLIFSVASIYFSNSKNIKNIDLKTNVPIGDNKSMSLKDATALLRAFNNKIIKTLLANFEEYPNRHTFPSIDGVKYIRHFKSPIFYSYDTSIASWKRGKRIEGGQVVADRKFGLHGTDYAFSTPLEWFAENFKFFFSVFYRKAFENIDQRKSLDTKTFQKHHGIHPFIHPDLKDLIMEDLEW